MCLLAAALVHFLLVDPCTVCACASHSFLSHTLLLPAGKRVKVEPLSGVATPRLKQLLSALLQVVQGSTSPGGTPSATRPGTPAGDAPGTAFANNVVSTGRIRISDEFVSNGVSNNGSNSGGINKVSAMMSMDRCVKLQALVVAARACLAPHIRAGNAACQGR